MGLDGIRTVGGFVTVPTEFLDIADAMFGTGRFASNGGPPSKGTPADKRLKGNKGGAMPSKMPKMPMKK